MEVAVAPVAAGAAAGRHARQEQRHGRARRRVHWHPRRPEGGDKRTGGSSRRAPKAPTDSAVGLKPCTVRTQYYFSTAECQLQATFDHRLDQKNGRSDPDLPHSENFSAEPSRGGL